MAATNNPYSALSSNVHQALDELNADETHYVPQREAEELFYLPDCVHIFFVKADGKVSTFSEPSTLRIFRFKQHQQPEGSSTAVIELQQQPGTTAFIQVGGWTHPLIPGQSPVLEAGNGAFMFPDVYGSEHDGAAVGIVIADDSAFNIEGEAQEALAKILNDLTVLKKEEVKQGASEAQPELKLGKIGKTLVKSAELVSKGLEKSAEKATTLIEYAGEKQKARTEATSEEVKVSPALKTTAKGVKFATKATVKVSGFVANRVGDLSRKTAEYVAKKVEKPVVTVTGGGAGSASAGTGMKKSSTKENIVDAAKGGIVAYATVFEGLENSAKVLGNSIKTESVSVVKHQYGEEAGNVYGDSMSSAGNAAMTYMNIQSLGVKGFLKKTAKRTGKNLGKAVIEAHSAPKGGDESNPNNPTPTAPPTNTTA